MCAFLLLCERMQQRIGQHNVAQFDHGYLATFEATKKWTMQIHNWGKIYGELSIMYEGRLPD